MENDKQMAVTDFPGELACIVTFFIVGLIVFLILWHFEVPPFGAPKD
jgi:hypothetical protein